MFGKRWGWIPVGLLASLCLLAGCRAKKRVEPVIVLTPGLGGMTIAVAPALNLSGAADFDPTHFADLMASELGYVEGVSVVPVSRVLSVLAVQGLDGVESSEHALELVGLLGADAILVFAVTEYDPYDPPSIGISAQLYGTRPGPGVRAVDPVALSRQASLAAASPTGSARGILAQVQRVFNASHGSVVRDVREFAAHRGGDNSPYGWRKYVVSQREYIRYCCHATIRALLASGNDLQVADESRGG